MSNGNITTWLIDQISDFLIILRDSSPPVDLENLAKSRNVKRINWFAKDLHKATSLLGPIDSGFYIDVLHDIPRTRKNFSVAHEIAHTFFFDIPKQDIPKRKKLYVSDDEEERACDRGAAEILIPATLLKRELDNYQNINLLTSVELTNKFHASIEVMVRRFHEMELINDLIICSKIKGKEAKPQSKKLRVDWFDGRINELYVYKDQRIIHIFPSNDRVKVKKHILEAWENIGNIIINDIELRPYKQKNLFKYTFRSVRIQKNNDIPFNEEEFSSSILLTHITNQG